VRTEKPQLYIVHARPATVSQGGNKKWVDQQDTWNRSRYVKPETKMAQMGNCFRVSDWNSRGRVPEAAVGSGSAAKPRGEGSGVVDQRQATGRIGRVAMRYEKAESELTTTDRSFVTSFPSVHLFGRVVETIQGLHVICMVPGGSRWSLEAGSEVRYQSEGVSQ
jgi:hypothetical protein